MPSLKPVIDIELGKITQTPMTTGNLGDFSSSAAHDSGHAARCKLPNLQMDEFSGDPLAWQGFWDRCQITIITTQVSLKLINSTTSRVV